MFLQLNKQGECHNRGQDLTVNKNKNNCPFKDVRIKMPLLHDMLILCVRGCDQLALVSATCRQKTVRTGWLASNQIHGRRDEHAWNGEDMTT